METPPNNAKGKCNCNCNIVKSMGRTKSPFHFLFKLTFCVFHSGVNALARTDNLEVTGVSRSGRVRKKSSKLVDFRSPYDIDATGTAKRAHHMPRTPSSSKLNATYPLLMAPSHPMPPSICSNDFAEIISAPKPSTMIKVEPELIIKPDESDINMLLPSSQSERFISATDFTVDDLNIAAAVPAATFADDDIEDDLSDSESDREWSIDTTVRKSAYMTEKTSRKKMLKDGKVVLGRLQRKDKGKPRFTSYMLWAREKRQEMLNSNPNLDFATQSRRLSEMWANMPGSDKVNWRRKAKRLAVRKKGNGAVGKVTAKALAMSTGNGLNGAAAVQTTSKFLNKTAMPGRPGRRRPGRPRKQKPMLKNTISAINNNMPVSKPAKKPKLERKSLPSTPNGTIKVADRSDTSITASGGSCSSSGGKQRHTNSKLSPTVAPGPYRVTGIGPSEVSAHLKLLGDNLTIIGERLKEHEVMCWFPIESNCTSFLTFIYLFRRDKSPFLVAYLCY